MALFFCLSLSVALLLIGRGAPPPQHSACILLPGYRAARPEHERRVERPWEIDYDSLREGPFPAGGSRFFLCIQQELSFSARRPNSYYMAIISGIGKSNWWWSRLASLPHPFFSAIDMWWRTRRKKVGLLSLDYSRQLVRPARAWDSFKNWWRGYSSWHLTVVLATVSRILALLSFNPFSKFLKCLES